jgi:predicted lipid-binding transport protein (Tim44 family)
MHTNEELAWDESGQTLTTTTVGGLAAGMAIGTLIAGPVGLAVGAAIGAGVGAIAGVITNEVAGVASSAENKAIDNLAKAYQKDNTVIDQMQ